MLIDYYIEELVNFLLSPLPKSLLSVHPNQAALAGFKVPYEWERWWDDPTPWQTILEYYQSTTSSVIPLDLRVMIDKIRDLQLVRELGTPAMPCFTAVDHLCASSPKAEKYHRTSPKKCHEVYSMVTFITELLDSSPVLKRVKYIVDVGSGQGYIAHALWNSGFHVLALDSSEIQARGAEKRKKEHPDPATGSFAYKTININPSTLLSSIDQWIEQLPDCEQLDEPVSIMIVALHACGSLTPDILRASCSIQNSLCSRKWVLRSAVIVGCCYNLIDRQDYPLSNSNSLALQLTPCHLQLSAQVPLTWLQTASNEKRTTESLKRVAWRAILQGILSDQTENICLGKFKDRDYADWSTFLASASSRLQVPISAPLEDDHHKLLERRLSILHALRCLLGSCIESLLIWDRYMFVKERIEESMQVELVNIFDQKQGSGRNVAIVIKPTRKT